MQLSWACKAAGFRTLAEAQQWGRRTRLACSGGRLGIQLVLLLLLGSTVLYDW